ncbi:c6 transcription factor [Moniliophthora roreri MCA 2997]|uniref:C6 transcription factor n=2 Tax=Moniliophthora roreri TaxID=221103 RepID=V2XC14_MONRO|nr:c6 transcription factor [Moniliophthora roreri MCA 2997]KAI3604453.1 c6 transcription factor [Moniliophthora roreri]
MKPSEPTSAADISADGTPVRTKRRYGASCELCRKRKRKCPGKDAQGNSLCTHCREVGVKCVFPPSRAKVALSSQSNVEVESLRRYIRKLARANQEDQQIMLSKWARDDEKKLALGRRTAPRVVSDQEEDEEPQLTNSTHNLRPNKRSRKDSQSHASESHSTPKSLSSFHESESEPEDAELDAIYRPESALRLSLKPEEPPPSEVSSTSDLEENVQVQVIPPFVPNKEVSAWIDYYIQNTFPSGLAADGPTLEERQILLDNYFSWQGPRNCVLNQELFEHALETNNPKYFTPFLLWSVYSHTARHVPQLAPRVYEYAAKAHILLAAELSRPSSIPTVQGLILLSANNAARGMYAQAWHMTASAVSMIIDLGIHMDKEVPDERASASPASGSGSDRARGGKRSKNYTARQMRLRAFWAAFVWDKLISLALNRTPLLSVDERRPPLPDPVEDDVFWKPYVVGECPPNLYTYQPQPRHQHKCFYENIRANEFLDEVHRFLYRKPWRRLPTHQVRDFVTNMRERMLEWQQGADPNVVLKANEDSLKSGASPPPPHILQLNILVRVIWILLYRPFYYTSAHALSALSPNASATTTTTTNKRHTFSPKTNHAPHPNSTSDDLILMPHAVSTCEQATIEIHILFRWYAEAFPLGRASYAVIFAAFLAATIDLGLADRQMGLTKEMDERLRLCEVVLKGGQGSVPGMQTSMERLARYLERVLETWGRANSDMTPGSNLSHAQSGLSHPEQKSGIAGMPIDEHMRGVEETVPALVPAYTNGPLSATATVSPGLPVSPQNLGHQHNNNASAGYKHTAPSLPPATMMISPAHASSTYHPQVPIITIPQASLNFRNQKYPAKSQVVSHSEPVVNANYQTEPYDRYPAPSVPHGRGEFLETGSILHGDDTFRRQDSYMVMGTPRPAQGSHAPSVSHVTPSQLPVESGVASQAHAYGTPGALSPPPQGYQFDNPAAYPTTVRDGNFGQSEWNAWFWPGEHVSLGGGGGGSASGQGWTTSITY